MRSWTCGKLSVSQGFGMTFKVDMHSQQHWRFGCPLTTQGCRPIRHRWCRLAPRMSCAFPSSLPVIPVWVAAWRVALQIRPGFAWTTLSNKRQWNTGSSRGCSQKNFSEPLYFYRPFGDSSAISSSILKRESTPPVGLVCGWIWKRETQTLIGKVDVPHIVLFFINISTVMLFSNSWTKTQLFLSCLQFWLCQTHLQHFKAHWASRLHTQWDTVHQVTRS